MNIFFANGISVRILNQEIEAAGLKPQIAIMQA